MTQEPPDTIIGAIQNSSPPVLIVALRHENLERIKAGEAILIKPEESGLPVAVIIAPGGESMASARKVVAQIIGKPRAPA